MNAIASYQCSTSPAMIVKHSSLFARMLYRNGGSHAEYAEIYAIMGQRMASRWWPQKSENRNQLPPIIVNIGVPTTTVRDDMIKSIRYRTRLHDWVMTIIEVVKRGRYRVRCISSYHFTPWRHGGSISGKRAWSLVWADETYSSLVSIKAKMPVRIESWASWHWRWLVLACAK